MEHTSKKKLTAPLIVLALSLGITMLIFSVVKRDLSKQSTQEFQNQAGQITSVISNRMTLYTNALYGAAGLFEASDDVSSAEWGDYVRKMDLEKNYSGISSMGYAKALTRDEVKKLPFVTYPKNDLKDLFTIVTYVQPTTPDRLKAIGFDLSSEEKRATTLSAARDTNSPVATPVVIAVSSQLPTISVYLPVYKKGTQPTSIASRKANLHGFVSTTFRVKELFQDIDNDPSFDPNIVLKIYDTNNAADLSGDFMLYSSSDASAESLESDPRMMSTVRTISVGGRTWTFHFYTTTQYSLGGFEKATPYLILVIGILISLLLAWIFYVAGLEQERAKVMAEKMTKDLEQSQRLFRLSMENAGDMIFITKLNGEFIDVNPTAQQILGYSKDELLKMSMKDIDLGRSKKDLDSLQKELTDKKSIIIEGKQKKKDGTNFDVEARITLFENDGEQMAISIVRDISERKIADEKLKERTDELERLNKLMIGRELKMADLKDKIKKQA